MVPFFILWLYLSIYRGNMGINKWSKEDIEQLRQMRSESIRYSDIAERLGRTYSTTVDAAKRFLKNDKQYS